MTTTLPATRRPAAPPALPAPVPTTVEPTVRRWGALPFGAALAMAAVVMFFAGLIGGVVLLRSASESWPTEEINLDRYIGNMLAITAVLPSVTVQWARYAVRNDDKANVSIALGMTTVFGLAVANLAWYAISKAGFGAGDHPFATLFHAIHGSYLVLTLGGTVAAVLTLLRGLAGQFTPEEHGMVTATATVWHLLTVLGGASWYAVWILR